ncbi:MAG: M55 family metallopeptidase [Candidatus Zipacnadales bacterium]
MKLYISADIEGVSGVTHEAQTSQTGAQYLEARQWMTGDVNAAIEGAFEAGVTEVLVKDAHGWALNILPHELDERATLIQGWGPEDGMMEGLTSEFGLAFLVGYHARAGTMEGILSHTWTGSLRRLVIAGVEMGEMGLSALLAGAHGVPIGLVTSCAAGQREAQALLPWAETVSVKRGITRHAAKLLPIKHAQALIRQGARQAVDRIREMAPLIYEVPYEVQVTWASVEQAQVCATVEGVTKVDPYTVAFTASKTLQALRKLHQVCRIAQSIG